MTASVGVAAAEPDGDGMLVDSAMLMHLADAACTRRSGLAGTWLPQRLARAPRLRALDVAVDNQRERDSG